jgi:hypothetical protein
MFNYCLIYSVKNDMLEMKKKIKEDKSREGAYIITVVLQARGSWMLGIELEEHKQLSPGAMHKIRRNKSNSTYYKPLDLYIYICLGFQLLRLSLILCRLNQSLKVRDQTIYVQSNVWVKQNFRNSITTMSWISKIFGWILKILLLRSTAHMPKLAQFH